jgi:hypothetical protein
MRYSSLGNRDLKINWWLWAGLSLPPIIYLLFHQQQDKAGGFHSEWSVLVDYATNKEYKFWYSWEIWVPHILFPLVLGWVAQYFLMLAWNYRRRRRVSAKSDAAI